MCGTSRTSAVRSAPDAKALRWPSSSTSPGNSSRTPPTVARSTSEPSFSDADSPSSLPGRPDVARTASTCTLSSPERRPLPGPTVVSPMPAAALSTSARPEAGVVAAETATVLVRPRPTTSVMPVTWSAWKWVRITRGTASTPSPSRHSRSLAGSGPASIRAAARGPIRTSVASPCPTSQNTTTQSGGGQPGGVGGRSSTNTSSKVAAAASHLLRSSRGITSTRPTQPARTNVTPIGVAGQTTAAAGNSSPSRAIQHRPGAHQPAPVAKTDAKGSSGTAIVAARNPSTVAGPTSGPATRFAASPTRLTCPDSSVTSGWVASWAASGVARPSASGRGSRCANASVQGRDQATMPPLASTDSANPAERAMVGSTNTITTTATHRARTARPPRPPAPRAARPTSPMAAARTPLGSAWHSRTKPTTPTPRSPRSHQPRTPHHRARVPRNASSRVRFAPDTAVRCVSPVIRNRSVRSAGIPAVSPTTRAGTNARGSGSRWAALARRPARTRSIAPSNALGSATTDGGSRARTRTAMLSPGSAGDSRTVAVRRGPGAGAGQRASASPLARTRTLVARRRR